MESVLITGATGLLGCGLARRLLSEGHQVTTLVRGEDDEQARMRMMDCLTHQFAIEDIEPPADFNERLIVHCVDITNRDALTNLHDAIGTNFDVVYHSAACVNFVDVRQCQDVNIEGTRNVLQLMSHVKPKRFNHISTAFVAGGYEGEIREDEMPPRQTLNAYEDTKYEAELIVRQQTNVPFTVHRPSIVVGAAKDGKIRAFKNFYLIVRYFARLAKRNKPPLRFPGLGEGRINLVPIDYVVEATAKIGATASEGKTYHIVNDSPPTTKAIVQAIEKAVDHHCVDFLGESLTLNEEEEATQTRFQEFMPYFFGSPSFQITGMERVMGDIKRSRLDDTALLRVAQFYMAMELNGKS